MRTWVAADAPASIELLRRATGDEQWPITALEKLAGPSPRGAPHTLAATIDDQVAGVAVLDGNRIRLLAVDPAYQRRGVGTALLDACVTAARTTGANALRTMDCAGNYVSPGINAGDHATIAWLRRRGFADAPPVNTNLLVDVRTNPKVSAAASAAADQRVAAAGYQVRRAGTDEPALLTAIERDFSRAWAFEVARALAFSTGGVHVAERNGELAGFAAHDGNNSGLGWFGPAGTWPAHRGHGVGEALLLRCLLDVARVHPVCEVAWIGPRAFYERVAGVAGERQFLVLTRQL